MAGAHVLTVPTAEQQLTEAFASFGDELIRALASLLGDGHDAHDVAQEAFLKCWRSRERLHEVRDLKAWIFRVGLNAARDLRRNVWRQRSRPLIDDAFADRGADASDCAHYEELIERLAVAVSRLRPEEREVFLLRHRRDMTYEQIARTTRTPLGTVKTRMRAALAQLRRTCGPAKPLRLSVRHHE
jgi:RNA polymerase sigma-70 factor (ECF subfamily)